MDPNEALKRAREAAKAFWAAPSQSREEYEAGVEMTEAFEALDEWLAKGGFLPDDWKADR